MNPRHLDASVSKADDHRTAAKYERQADRTETIALRHTRLAVESAVRGEEERSRFERAQSRLAWDAARLDRRRAAALRERGD